MPKHKRFHVSLITLLAILFVTSFAYADLKPGTKAPAFSLPTVDGKTFKLSSSSEQPAKPVVLDIWATWCRPCRNLIPYVVDLHKNLKDKAVFVGVSTDTNKETVKKFVDDAGIKYTIALDPYASTIGSDYKVSTIPALYLIDKKGVIRYVHKGLPASKDGQKTEVARIEKEIRELAAE